MEYLEESTRQKSQNVTLGKDEHEKFFDSLLSVVRQFDVDQTLAFRAEMINVIQRIKYGTIYNTFMQYQQPHAAYPTYQHYQNNYHGMTQSSPSPAASTSSQVQYHIQNPHEHT